MTCPAAHRRSQGRSGARAIEALTGAEPSPGFVHSMIERTAAAVAGANKAIRCLIILAHVICADETPIRVGPGPKTRKRYLLVACTNLLTCYFLGDRSMDTFDGFVFPDLSGVIVHDRYHNYDKIPASSTSCAVSTCSGTWKTRPSPTPALSGPARSPMPCAPSSTPPIPPASRD